MKELTIEASLSNLEQVLCFVDTQLETVECSMKTKMKIDVAVEEIFVNIVSYAYTPASGPATVQVDFEENPDTAVITFIDHGIPYDPLNKEDPDITLSAHEREIGGLGIFMVKKSMDDIAYQYRDGQNILTVRKALV